MVALSLLFGLFGCGSSVSWELLKSDCVPTAEVWYDGVDQDCDGNDDDQDGDGVSVGEDCWDDPNDETHLGEAVGAGLTLTAADVYPGAEDAWYDGVDQDCDGSNDFDQDGDGFDSANDEKADGSVGDDCVDGSPNDEVFEDSCSGELITVDAADAASVNPDATDTFYDGVDQNCDGADDNDADGDGYAVCNECDDTDADTFPSDIPEIWYDCQDQNCDGNDGDRDGDNYVDADYTADCTDWARINPGKGDGDCWDDITDSDPDYSAINGSPQLSQADVHPDAEDIPYDAVDAACDGDTFEFDADQDGYDSDAEPDRSGARGADCHDDVASAYPGATEECDTENIDHDCDGNLNDPSALGCVTFYTDADKDSYGLTTSQCLCEAEGTYTSSNNDDCDDNDKSVNPAATEGVGDNKDQNCDGAESCYTDADNDGYRDSASTVLTSTDTDCNDSGEATASDGTGDCNDSSATISPGASEVCDSSNTDEDCDGKADNDDLPSTTTTRYYKDADSDTYGAASDTGSLLCDASTTYKVTNKTDCNDSNASINPAATEIAGDEVDQNCDASETCYKDADNDGYRPDSTSTVSSTDTDCADSSEAKSSEPTTDCDDAKSTVNPAATEVCDTSNADEDCDGLADDLDSSVSSSSKTRYYRDLDADTYGDENDTGSLSCDATSTYKVTDNTDCDDSNASTNPAKTTDTCWNGVDEDCDAVVDEGSSGTSCYLSTGGELVVSELFVLGDATTDPQGEWFEVYNPSTSKTVYMESMTITRQNTSTGNVSFTVNDVVAVAPMGTVVFCYVDSYLGSDCDFEYGAITGTNFALTQNNGTTLVIATTSADVASRTLDSVNYNGAAGGAALPWPGVTQGYSYELKTSKLTATGNDSGLNWCETTGSAYYSSGGNSDSGTPNATNTCP